MKISTPLKWILVFLISSQVQFQASGQGSCAKSIFNPDANLNNRFFEQSEIKFRYNITYRKINTEIGAPDIDYPQDCNNKLTCSINGEDLRYDMYYPKNHNYAGCPLPVMIMFHPGGYSDCSNKDIDYMQTWCMEYARRGFVAINLEYRRGVDENENQLGNNLATTSQMLAIYRTVQDVRGAIRSVIARQNDNSFPDVNIDPNNIFIGGAGTTVLNAAYYTQEMFNVLLPGIEQSLGKIDEDFYYGSTTIPVKVRGIMNLWGGIITPMDSNFANYFINNKTNLAPVISFHGASDGVIPLEQAKLYLLDSPFNTQKFCVATPFRMKNKNGGGPDLLHVGSKRIYEFFRGILGIPTELYVDCNMANKLSQNSGFGTGITNIDSIQNYIVSRSATFFQAVVNNFAKDLKDSKFTDCVNYRTGSFKVNDNDGCNFSDKCPRYNELSPKFWEAEQTITAAKQKLFTSNYVSKVLSVKMIQPGHTIAELFNQTGLKVKIIRNETGMFSVDLNGLQSGIYFLSVQQNGAMQTEKILIQ